MKYIARALGWLGIAIAVAMALLWAAQVVTHHAEYDGPHDGETQ